MFSFTNFDKRTKEKGMTKLFLAQQIDKHPSIFHDWRKGKSAPSETDLNIIASCLKCTTGYLKGLSSSPIIDVSFDDESPLRILADPVTKVEFDNETVGVAEQFSALSPENRARMKDYLTLLNSQGEP